MYVQLPKGSGENFRRLAGWMRVPLAAGERKTVTIPLEWLALASWNEKNEAWTWMPGAYTFSAGDSSRDLPLTTSAQIK